MHRQLGHTLRTHGCLKDELPKKVFFLSCRIIEREVDGLRKERLLVDVDGTQIQIYYAPEGEIKVVNDYEVDAVYVNSEMRLHQNI